MRNLLGVRKPGQLKRVGRLMTGPEVAGSRSVLVFTLTFTIYFYLSFFLLPLFTFFMFSVLFFAYHI